MLPDWSSLLAPALQDRIALLLNHVIAREPAAMSRLLAHQGRCVRLHLRGWPTMLPAAPDLWLGITPAGLLERLDASDEADLLVSLDASNPAALALACFLGQRPAVQVQGDAALAGDINWLMENLRWDIEDDLAKLVGPVAAHQCCWLASGFAKAMAGFVGAQRA